MSQVAIGETNSNRGHEVYDFKSPLMEKEFSVA